MKIRVAGAQLAVTEDIQANKANVLRAIEFAHDEKADFLLTPEGTLSGYRHTFEQPEVATALEAVTTAAREASVGLALGTCFYEPDESLCLNQLRLYTPEGEYLGYHSKILNCCEPDNPEAGEHQHFGCKPLKTFKYRGTSLGALICNDMWGTPGYTPVPNPHLSQQLARLGARLVFHAVNGGRDGSAWSREVIFPYHESNLRLRARAGKLWIVTVDNCSPADVPCAAPSGVLNPEGNWACKVPDQGEQFFAYTIELDE